MTMEQADVDALQRATEELDVHLSPGAIEKLVARLSRARWPGPVLNYVVRWLFDQEAAGKVRYNGQDGTFEDIRQPGEDWHWGPRR